MSASTERIAALQAVVDLQPRIIEVLEAIERNDKTVYDYNGHEAFNRDGRKPETGRWQTPQELAHDLLKELRAHDYARPSL